MHTLSRDFRYGLRRLLRSPSTSLIAVAALGLGIGANTAIFSVVKTVLLDPLPVREPERLVTLVHRNDRNQLSSPTTPFPEVREWQRTLRSFERVAAHLRGVGVVDRGEEPDRVTVSRVSASFFPMLGVHPFRGRWFTEEEDRPGASRVAVVTHELFAKWFGGEWSGGGGALVLDGERHEVVGVLPPRFRFVGERADLFVPLALPEERPPQVLAYGRLKTGVAREEAQRELDAVAAATAERRPAYQGWRIQMGRLDDWIVPDVRTGLWVLLGAVGLVLLIACANVAALLLSRAAARRTELAVRRALGATPAGLAFGTLAEMAPLALAGGAAALLLAWWGVRVLPRLGVSRIPRVAEVEIDGTVLAFTAVLSLATCLLFGLAPALAASRVDSSDALKESGRTASETRGSSRLRSALVVMEIALALTLAVGATLMARTFRNLSAVEPGFDPANVLAASVEVPRGRFTSKEQIADFYRQALERVRGLPGVEAAGLTSSLPLGGNYYKAGFPFEGHRYSGPADVPIVNIRTVDGGYFRALRIPLVRGRFFDEGDREGSQRVVLINETVARRFFAGQDPLGKRIGGGRETMVVVGVVPDVKHTDVSLGPDTEVLLPLAQNPMLAMTFVVRVDPRRWSDPVALIPRLRRSLAELDRSLPVFRTDTMTNIMAIRLGPRRLNMILLTLFAALAMFLAALGIYGVLAQAVARRSHEIGIRIALGAGQRDVVWLVVRQAMALAAVGLAIGIGAAIALGRVIRGALFQVAETDPVGLAAAALVLAAVSAAAAWIPARRASRVDPAVALRWE